MFVERIAFTLTVDASGNLTTFSAAKVPQGRVLQMRYVPDGSIPLDTNADITITGEDTGVAIATLANIGVSAFTKVVRQASHHIDGTASLYAAGGTAVNEAVYISGERIKVVVAQGGASKTGTLYLWIG